jgi:hypothetical protein
MENQIEQRLSLLNSFTKSRTSAIVNKLSTDVWDKLINITINQISTLISKEVELFFKMDFDEDNGQKHSTVDRILVIDINYLAYKGQTKKAMEKEYGCKVLLIDGSRQNTQGLEKNYTPAYFI